jgi:recombination protein RecR
MLQESSDLENLIKLFAKLPSFGPRSAKRAVLHLLNNKSSAMQPLIASMQKVERNITNCSICGNLDSAKICSICTNKSRDDNIICVVEDVADLWALEKGGIFKGKYHILGGVLCAINGKGPEDLNISSLMERIQKHKPQEIILATNSTMEGQTTAYYLLELLKEFDIKVSKLTSGIPIGSELDYLDDGTLEIAFKTRGGF